RSACGSKGTELMGIRRTDRVEVGQSAPRLPAFVGRAMLQAMARDSTHTVETADGPMAIYDVAPDAKAAHAVVVIQEAFGVNDYVRDVTGRFAAAGYRAVAPTMFHRAGGGTAPYDDFSKVLPLFQGITDDAILMDVDATTAYLRKA